MHGILKQGKIGICFPEIMLELSQTSKVQNSVNKCFVVIHIILVYRRTHKLFRINIL